MTRAGIRDIALGLAAGLTSGLAAMPAARTLYAQAISPVVIISPYEGSTVASTVTIRAIAGAPLEGIQFKVSGVDLGPEITSGACSAAWNTGAGNNGPYTLTVVGRDSAGNRLASLPVHVTVANGVGGGGGGSGSGSSRSRLTLERNKFGRELPPRRTSDPPEPGAPPQPCTTPDPFIKLPGIVGVCVNGSWVPTKK